jgi:uncharacterized protein
MATNPAPEVTTPADSSPPNLQPWSLVFRDQTLQCLESLRDRLGQVSDPAQLPSELALMSDLQPWVGQLNTLIHKIRSNLLQVAVFGHVSRGKSALLNAILGEPLLPIGPLNGVTQWPRTLRWTPPLPESTPLPLEVEWVDTPGLDDVDGGDDLRSVGDHRARMAQEIALGADLLLFIIVGKPNGAELRSLEQLRQAGKPLLLVSNKSDLHPDLTPQILWEALGSDLQTWLSETDIVCTAANPAPVKVRTEYPDGRTTESWEIPPPQVQVLQERLQTFFTLEGWGSVLLNALQQATVIQRAIAQYSITQQQPTAQRAIGRLGVLKAMGVGMLPVAWLDGIVNGIGDLMLVRSLVKTYGLPTPRHEVEALWRTIFFSTVGVLLSDLASRLMFGVGHLFTQDFESLGGVLAWGGTAMLQGIVAFYGAQRVGEATQTYLLAGCTWQPLGPSQVQEAMLQILPDTLQIQRLKGDRP